MFRKIPPGNYLILLCILLVGVFCLIKLLSGSKKTFNQEMIPDDNSKWYTNIPDSMPFKDFKAKMYSIGHEDPCEKSKLLDHGKGLYTSFAGFTVIDERDNCKDSSAVVEEKRYLVLPGYSLNSSYTFSIRDAKYYLATTSATPDSPGTKVHNTYSEIGVRYAGNHSNYREGGMVLIPVSDRTYNIVEILTYIIVVLIPLCFIVFVIILPIRVLYSIAIAKAFTKRNVRSLYMTGWFLIALALLPGLISILLKFMFAKRIPAEISLPIQDTLLKHSGMLVVGLVVLLLAGAFRQGYKTQE